MNNSAYEDKIVLFLRKYDCAFNYIKSLGRKPTPDWMRWNLYVDPFTRKYAIHANNTYNPLAYLLVNRRVNTRVMSFRAKASDYSKILVNYTPLNEIDAIYGMLEHPDIFTTAFYHGLIEGTTNRYFDGFEHCGKLFGYNAYRCSFYLGRYILNKYYMSTGDFPRDWLSKFK